MTTNDSLAPAPEYSPWYAGAMENLVDIIQDLSLTRDLEGIMKIVRTAARSLTGADGATFVLRDEEKCYYADEDAISPLWKGQRFPMTSCVSGWAMIHGKPVVIEDIYQDERIPADAYRPTFVKSMTMVPIRTSKPVGAIGNYWANQRMPREEEIRILQALANATSIAMENVDLYARLQKELQAVEKNILDNIVEGILTLNDQGTIVRYNKACQKIFGYTQKEVLGQDIRQFLPQKRLAEFEKAMNGYRAGSLKGPLAITGLEIEGQGKNKKKFPAELSMNEIHIGENRYFSAIVRDITDRKKSEEELRIARAEADHASEAKSEFLAHMSHELRTPLNSIIGLTRMLAEDETLETEQGEMARISHKSAHSLLEIVNEILDLSKIESGKLELEQIIFSLEEVVHNVIETLLPQCSEKGIILVRDLQIEDIPYFIGDPLRIGRVLINLIGNAIKYTEKGAITLTLSWEKKGKNKAVIQGSVTDTGIGIAQGKIDTIFGRFMQADSSITRRYGGTGLGLAITREVIEKMGGTIGVESKPGRGSRFHFTIPLSTAQMRPAISRKSFSRDTYERQPASQRIKAEDLNILIAEDHLLNQAFMQKLLPRLGLRQYRIVDNGGAVIEELDQHPYDMLLIDCHMPIMSGYDATEYIREKEQKTGRHIPIIAMTADAMIGTRERCLKSGMDDYIAKPLNQDELRYIMAQWVTFPDEKQPAEDAANGGGEVITLGRLLEFADDAAELQSFFDLFLTQSGGDLEVLADNCTEGENILWSKTAHRLKGTAGIVEAEKLKILLDQAQCMTTATARERKAMLEEIRKEYERVIKILRQALQSSPQAARG